MVVPNMLEFGGLEKIATHMAIALKQQGVPVSVVSTRWAPPENQYRRLLAAHGVPYVQAPRWLVDLAADWPTKERVVRGLASLLMPVAALLAVGVVLRSRRPYRQALASARGWLSLQLMQRWIGPDRHKAVARWVLAWWHWRWRPHLLHVHGYTQANLFVLDWAHARRVPAVYAENQTPDPNFDWWQGFAGAINKATLVLAPSALSAEGLRAICGVTRPIVLFDPIVPDPGPLPYRANGSRQALQVTTVARLYVTKGLTYLLEAIEAVRARFPGTRFTVYGDGPMRQELLDEAARRGLDGEAIFAGTFTVDDLPAIMEQTDIFVSASVLEGLPLAIVEAMAFGRPIVATTAGGVGEVLTHGETGLLCQPRSPACLAEHIACLIDNPARRAQLAAAARAAYLRGRFHPDTVGRHLQAVYRQALEQAA